MKQVIALGFFDGVHRGHGALLRLARQRADALGCPAAVLTFDAHPDTVLFGQPVPLIQSMEDRWRILSGEFAVDRLIPVHFDRAMMSMPWQQFVTDFLVRDHGACHVVCGHDFTFGHKGLGNGGKLRSLCETLGVTVDVVEPVTVDGGVVSSTRIRQLIHNGDLEAAARLLGRPHFLTATVIHGKALGRTLGIPTANLRLPQGVAAPAFGVYATRVTLPDGTVRPAVTNVGVRPTVDDGLGLLIEPWILDFDGDLYGRELRLEFGKRLRGEVKFPDLEALKAEIQKNARETRAFYGMDN